MKRALLAQPLRAVLFVATALSCLPAQGLPEILYYRFSEGAGTTTANAASPGAGATNPTITGHTLAAAGGQFGGCLLGVTSGTGLNRVNTNWIPALGANSWTISFWFDNAGIVGTGTASLMYVFGETGSTLRCSINSTSGSGNLGLRGGFTTISTTGGPLLTGPKVFHIVHDSNLSQVRIYVNGVLNVTSNQLLNINGNSGLQVGGYSAGGSPESIQTGTRLDEFRVYNRAVSAAEITATWNMSLTGAPLNALFSANPTSGGAPVRVQFTNQSTSTAPGGITNYAWDFENDGMVDSNAQNPSHIFPNTGASTVRLTVTDAVNGSISTTQVLNFAGLGFIAETAGNGAGDLLLWPADAPLGCTDGYTFISATLPPVVGAGTFFGITLDDATISVLSQPAFVGNFLHFIPSPGAYPDVPFSLPAGSLPGLNGVSFDVVVVYLVPPSVQFTPARRLTF